MDKNIWIVDDDESIRWVLEKGLAESGMDVQTFDSANKVIKRLETENPQLILTDIRMPGPSGIELLDKVKELRPEIPVIIMTAHSDLDSAVESYEHGAWEYLPKPFDIEEAISMVQRATAADEDKKEETSETQAEVIGEAPAMQEVFRAIGKLSNSNSTVLLNGESGTGKELVARALFQHSPRRDKPFIALNMADIPKELIESELFGHEKGSFTGATQTRIGKFEQSHQGTLFLDELGDMSLPTQTKMLRVLQSGTFERLGSNKPVEVDVRVIAATNQPLEQAVSEKTFREDLFYRLNVVRIQLPALRDRQEDIPLLVHYFLRKFSKIYKQAEKSIHQDALQALKIYRWPGNVRELENVIQRAFVVSKGDIILWSNLPAEVTQDAASHPTGPDATPPMPSTPQAPASVGVAPQGPDDGLNSDIDQLTQALFQWTRLHPDQKLIPTVERELVRQALKEVKGNQVRAASLLGITRATLRKRIEKFDIRQEINVD